MHVSNHASTRGLLDLTARILARQLRRMDAEKKDRPGGDVTEAASTANIPRSEESYDATRV